MPVYQSCAEAKAKQKSLPSREKMIEKETIRPKKIPGKVNEIVDIDLSMVQAPKDAKTTVAKPYWLLNFGSAYADETYGVL